MHLRTKFETFRWWGLLERLFRRQDKLIKHKHNTTRPGTGILSSEWRQSKWNWNDHRYVCDIGYLWSTLLCLLHQEKARAVEWSKVRIYKRSLSRIFFVYICKYVFSFNPKWSTSGENSMRKKRNQLNLFLMINAKNILFHVYEFFFT